MKTTKLTYTSLFIVLGIILPRIIHTFGMGSILLPMHIPVLIGAMVLGPIAGILIGTISVLIGFLLGMPILPMAGFMFFELAIYGLVAGYLGYTKKLNIYISLIVAMIAGRVVSIILMQISIRLIGLNLPPVFGTIGMFSAGVPGMLIQIAIIPKLVEILRRHINVEQIRTIKE